MDNQNLQKLVEGLADTLGRSGMKCALLIVIRDGEKVMRSVILREINVLEVMGQFAQAIDDLSAGRIQLKPTEPPKGEDLS